MVADQWGSVLFRVGPSGMLCAMAIDPRAPTTEIGAQTNAAPVIPGFGTLQSFIDDAEYVSKWMWPQSVETAHHMRSDAQTDALHMGTTLPVRSFTWSLDPNGCPARLVDQVAEDLGLPVRGHEDENVPMAAYRFNFDEFLSDVLLAPLYGHFPFEQVGEVNEAATEWHLRKLAPRHPRTIADFVMDPSGDGGLVGIRQNIARRNTPIGGGFFRLPPLIPIEKLVMFVWRRESGSWVGRSILRSMYREWFVKDKALKVWATNLERAGGVPVAYGAQGATDQELRDLAGFARQFKVSEAGGGAMPFASKLELVGSGSAVTAEGLVRYCDEAMARVWAMMVIQLGQTETGSRALGGTFADLAAKFQRGIAKWVARTFDEHVLKDYIEFNDATARYAPRLHFEQTNDDAMSTDEMVALINAGALTVDPELESWIRGERGLPAPPEPPDGGATLGGLTPDEVALVQNSRTPPALPAPGGQPPTQPPPGAATAARMAPVRAVRMPDRAVRRQAYGHEVQAAVDFAELDRSFELAVATAEELYLRRVIPEQIDALTAAITTTKAGDARKVVTRAGMAAITAPVTGRDELVGVLLDAARAGMATAVEESAAQGVTLQPVPDEVLRGLVGDQADAVTKMAANGISLAAQRKATQLVGGGRTPGEIAEEVRAHLTGMAHQWTKDQLRGATQMAQNAGRFAVMEQAERGQAVSFYVSALLDSNTCAPCIADDGREFNSVAEMRALMPSGGNMRCEGGPRCRCVGVAVFHEQDPSSAANPLVPALA